MYENINFDENAENFRKEISLMNSSNLSERSLLKQKFEISRNAFSTIVENSSSFKGLLNSIKSEYDSNIFSLENKYNETYRNSSKLKVLAGQSMTHNNISRRKEELERKILIIKRQNALLASNLHLKTNKTVHSDKELNEQKPHNAKGHVVKGLSLDDSLNLQKLEKFYLEVQLNLKTLLFQKDNKYVSKEDYDKLWYEYSNKLVDVSKLENEYNDLHKRLYYMNIALSAAESSKQDLFLCDVIHQSLLKSVSENIVTDTMSTTEPNELISDFNVDYLLECVEKFHHLINEKFYIKAATYAAKSPLGILRNEEVHKKFANISKEEKNDDILLMYGCEMLDTVNDYLVKPTEDMCMDYIACALKLKKFNIVEHWIKSDFIKKSKKLADFLMMHDYFFSSDSCSMAETIYMKIGAWFETVKCIALRGDIALAIHFAQTTAKLDKEEYIELLQTVPSADFALALGVQHNDNGIPLLPFGQSFLALISENNIDVCVNLINKLDLTVSNEIIGNRSILADKWTSIDDWEYIANVLTEFGHFELGLEIVSTFTTFITLQKI